jgi:hypothetical protein
VFIAYVGFHVQKGVHDPFAEHGRFNGLDRADRRALTAQGAPVFVPQNLPGQIGDA